MARYRRRNQRSTSQRIAGLVALGLPAPVQRVADTRLGPFLMLLGIPVLIITGILNIQWENGAPHLAVNGQRATEVSTNARRHWDNLTDQPTLKHLGEQAESLLHSAQNQYGALTQTGYRTSTSPVPFPSTQVGARDSRKLIDQHNQLTLRQQQERYQYEQQLALQQQQLYQQQLYQQQQAYAQHPTYAQQPGMTPIQGVSHPQSYAQQQAYAQQQMYAQHGTLQQQTYPQSQAYAAQPGYGQQPMTSLQHPYASNPGYSPQQNYSAQSSHGGLQSLNTQPSYGTATGYGVPQHSNLQQPTSYLNNSSYPSQQSLQTQQGLYNPNMQAPSGYSAQPGYTAPNSYQNQPINAAQLPTGQTSLYGQPTFQGANANAYQSQNSWSPTGSLPNSPSYLYGAPAASSGPASRSAGNFGTTSLDPRRPFGVTSPGPYSNRQQR